MSESETRNTPIDEEPADIDEAAPEAPPVTGEPEAASYVGRYDARDALLRRVVDGLEETQKALSVIWTGVGVSRHTLENASDHDAGLLLTAKDAFKLGGWLKTASLRAHDLQERLKALLEECRG